MARLRGYSRVRFVKGRKIIMRKLWQGFHTIVAATLAWCLLAGTLSAGEPRIDFYSVAQPIITDPDVLSVYAPGDVVLINTPQELRDFYVFVRPGQKPPEVDF